MARTRSARIEAIKNRLRARLQEGAHRPGDRFLSGRAVAARYEISYQTAHRLICELQDEGCLQRRASSGTYLPGGDVLTGAVLVFNARAKRSDSFGARLHNELKLRLERERIAFKTLWLQDSEELSPENRVLANRFPVLWEVPMAVERLAQARRAALLLNDRPPPGLSAAYLDSVSADDFSGGVCAAQLLLKLSAAGAAIEKSAKKNGEKAKKRRFAILSGPLRDTRSTARGAGFSSLIPNASVIVPDGWFYEDGYGVAARAAKKGRDGLFCCNDRLAESVVAWCRDNNVEAPPLVGFDDAPIAETLNLSTIAIPWREMMAGASGVIKRRLAGDASAASQLVFAPRPVVRGASHK